MDPNANAASPGAVSPTSGTPQGSTSPAPTEPTSGDGQVVELRKKVTEQAEQLKTLQASLENSRRLEAQLHAYPDKERLVRFLQTGTYESASPQNSGGTSESAEQRLAQAFEEVDGEKFVAALRDLRAEIEGTVTKKFEGKFTSLGQQATDTKIQTFFAGKEAPDQAAAGSPFWNFVADLAKNTSVEGRTVATLFESDLEAALSYAWDRYVAKNGDPAAAIRQRRADQDRLLASMETGGGLPSNFKAFVNEGKPQRRSMVELNKLLRSKGVIKE